MEIRLTEWVRETRELGIPVETYMLAIIGREMLEEEFPERYANQDSSGFKEPFLFSNHWQLGYFNRFGFSVHRFMTTKTILRNKGKAAETIRQFHLETRACQLSVPAPLDSIYGIAPKYAVYNRDQVPIALCASYARTVDHTGAAVVLNSVDKDDKRFCTLNPMIPMEVLPDFSNLPKPHIVFQGVFKGGDAWHDANEHAQWDPRVVVSFQEYAWVDARTNLYGLEHTMKPINDDFLSKQPF
jgi:hypothetical protein